MRSRGVHAWLLAALTLCVPATAARADATPDALVLGTDGALSAQVLAVLALDGATYVERPFYTLVHTTDPDALATQLRGLPGLRYVERQFVYRAQTTTNDPDLAQQGYLATIDAERAWGTSTGRGVIVGVIDTGADLTHPDLAPNLLVRGGEIPGNGIDDDHDGIVDDHVGANLVARSGDGADDGGHGTEVAGVVAAAGDNGIGIAGVAYGAKVDPLKALASDGSGTSTDIADAIRLGVADGARVVNLSLIGPDDSQAIDDAIAQAAAAGTVVVVAAGNQAQNIDVAPLYPAASGAPNVIAVAASGADGSLTSFSNSGPRNVLVSAPGAAVLTTTRGGGVGLDGGTSLAAPQVAGMLALLISAHPDLTVAGLRDALATAARACHPLAAVGSGLLCAPGDILSGSPAPPGGAATAGRTAAPVRLTLSRPARSGRRVRLRWTLRGGGLVRRLVVVLDGRRVRALRASARGVVLSARAGRHRVSVLAVDPAGRPLARADRAFR